MVAIPREKRHGMSRTRVYVAWRSMKRRCYAPSVEKFAEYGGRGIKVCERWRESFAAFYEDMGDPPPGASLDRLDNDGDYAPGNCRWATQTQQLRNTRRNRLLTYAGKTLCIAAWADEVGLSQQLIWNRLRKGWSVERALTESYSERHNTIGRK